MSQEAIKELIMKMADDALIIGHRNSEWTGIGPVLEEDIAFASMAQDKIGHAQALYNILHENCSTANADTLAFGRKANEFTNCQLVELPIGEYDFSLVRQYFFDHAELLRYEMLKESSFKPLANLAAKVFGEIKYHCLHADAWMQQFAEGNETGKARIQTAINEVFPYALGIFEEGDFEQTLIAENIFKGEQALKARWLKTVREQLAHFGFRLTENTEAVLGGRKKYHSEHLDTLVNEMTEVYQSDLGAEW